MLNALQRSYLGSTPKLWCWNRMHDWLLDRALDLPRLLAKGGPRARISTHLRAALKGASMVSIA
jgi:hypothetical protein